MLSSLLLQFSGLCSYGFLVKEVSAFLECLFCFQFRHNACPLIMNIELYIVEAVSVDIKFLIFFFLLGDVYLYSFMQKSKEVCDSILVIMMNMYYPHCPFPSRKWRVAKDYENLRESA
jgi:hypothetical protein